MTNRERHRLCLAPAWVPRVGFRRRRSGRTALALLAGLLLALTHNSHAGDAVITWDWQQLRPLPDPLGVAGCFAGASGGALIVAGGANFPDGFPWQGGRKAWHRAVWVLTSPAGDWTA